MKWTKLLSWISRCCICWCILMLIYKCKWSYWNLIKFNPFVGFLILFLIIGRSFIFLMLSILWISIGFAISQIETRPIWLRFFIDNKKLIVLVIVLIFIVFHLAKESLVFGFTILLVCWKINISIFKIISYLSMFHMHFIVTVFVIRVSLK